MIATSILKVCLFAEDTHAKTMSALESQKESDNEKNGG